MRKKIILAFIIVVLIILGFILSRDKTIAPTSEKQVSMPSEIKQADENSNVSSQGAQLEIKVTQEGTGSRTIKTGDIIDVYYSGKLTNGKIFDSNIGSDQPFEFTVGTGMVIKGWDQGFIGAKVGEKRTLIIPPDLAYGTTGQGSIPPNATLIFDTEVVSIK